MRYSEKGLVLNFGKIYCFHLSRFCSLSFRNCNAFAFISLGVVEATLERLSRPELCDDVLGHWVLVKQLMSRAS